MEQNFNVFTERYRSITFITAQGKFCHCSGFKTKTYIVCDLHKGKENRYQRNIFNGLMLAITSLNNKNTRKYEILKN